MANILKTEKRVQILSALIEGHSIRATSRMVGCSKNTTTKLLVDLGQACAEYQDERLRDLPCSRIEADEIWSFCQMKAKTAKRNGRDGEWGVGDVWTFVAICADTKLVPTWLVGSRDGGTATEFCQDLRNRLAAPRVQLSTDGHKMYLDAVEDSFGADIDFGQIIKLYGEDPQPQKRYSPAKVLPVDKAVVQGNPDERLISTSYVERQNLTMRMSMRRFTRLTNAFSKKIENHCHAIAVFYMAYNFVKPHGTLTKRNGGIPTTPAMEAGVATKPWKLEEVVGLLGSN